MHSPDAKLVCARYFGKATATYDRAAQMQRATGHQMVELIGPMEYCPVVLDVGAGTGYFSELLEKRYRGSSIIAIDLSQEMLLRARSRFQGSSIRADAESLPIASGSVDLVFSNLCIQWCPSLERVFREFARVLKSSGQLVFSTMGSRTLFELREAWSRVDTYSHAIDFHGADRLDSAIESAGLQWEVRRESEEVRLYPDVRSLMLELKALGARNASSNRAPHLTGPRRFSEMVRHYMSRPGVLEGEVPATYSIIGGCCRLKAAFRK